MANPILNVGDPAPDFTLPSDTDGDITLSKLRGQKVILYFYPKDMTPGCTTQACDFNDNFAALQEQGWVVLGVSPDSVETHRKFRQKHDLGFTLLADEDNAVAKAYGVWREKTNYGKKYVGMVRSTFLIDADGKLSAIYDNVRATGHVGRLLRDLA